MKLRQIKAHILIVDDQEANLETMESILAEEDYRIEKARSGAEALEVLLNHEFACVLMDVRMPEMDGIETAKIIRQDEQIGRVPIIFVTAEPTDQEKVFEGYQTGAVDFLLKPLNMNIVKSKVKVFVELYRQRIALDKSALIEAMNAELQEANKEINRLLYISSHHLREPIARIKLLSQLVLTENLGKLPEETNCYLQKLITETNQIGDLLNGLNRYNLLIAKKATFTLVDLDRTVEKVVSLLGKNLSRKNVMVTRGSLPVVMANQQEMEMLFFSLIESLLAFAGVSAQPRLDIRAGCRPDDYFIVITGDNFVIDKDIIDNIFDLFGEISLDKINMKDINLAICQKIVHRHKGKIVASSADKKCCFTIFLPISHLTG